MWQATYWDCVKFEYVVTTWINDEESKSDAERREKML